MRTATADLHQAIRAQMRGVLPQHEAGAAMQARCGASNFCLRFSALMHVHTVNCRTRAPVRAAPASHHFFFR
jgi:hypothetical protein